MLARLAHSLAARREWQVGVGFTLQLVLSNVPEAPPRILSSFRPVRSVLVAARFVMRMKD